MLINCILGVNDKSVFRIGIWVDLVQRSYLITTKEMKYKLRKRTTEVRSSFYTGLLRNDETSFTTYNNQKRLKEMSFCQTPKLSNLYIVATWWCKPLIFQT